MIIPQETPSAPISSAAAIRAGKILAPLWGRVVLFGALYLIGAGVGRYLSPPEFPFVTFWLPSGLYVATLLRQQTRHWAAFVAAAVVANLAFDLVNGQVPPTALLFAIANSAEALTGAWLVRRLVAPSPDLSKVREVVGVIGWSALASTTLSATIGAGTVAFINGNGSFGQTWLLWWSGDVTGIVLLATSILGWRKDIRWWLAWPPTRRQAEAGAAVALAFLACFFLLFDPWHRDLPLKYGTIPIVLFVNYRYGPRASWLIVLLVALLATWLTAHGFSDIARGGLPQRVQVTALQLFLAVVALTALLQSALLAEWRRDAQRIRDQAQILAHIGDTVTATDLEGRILYVNDAQCRTLQRTPEELLGQSVEVFGDDPLRGATQRKIIAATRRDGRWAGEVVNRTNDGRELNVQVRTSLVRNPDGEPIGMVGVGTDITERRQAEERTKAQLEELQRWQRVMLDREDRVQELKREVNELCRQQGLPVRYSSQTRGSASPNPGAPRP